MLYIFAGYPKTGLNAGGLQHAVETVEELGLLEHDPAIQYRKEGVFMGSAAVGVEPIGHVQYRISDVCLRDGITWDWFPENWSFGNGGTVHKTLASPEYRTVVHGTDLTLDEWLATFGNVKLADLELRRKHNRTEGWEAYEKRWLPGTCPQENHVVHLTWLVAKHEMPSFAYERLRCLVEVPGTELVKPGHYQERHFSMARIWDGKGAFHQGTPALGAIV